MKFDYKIFKSLVPAIKSKEDLVEKIESHLFEVESVVGDALDIKVLPNRYSDAACYYGLAREISAMHDKVFSLKIPDFQKEKARTRTICRSTAKDSPRAFALTIYFALDTGQVSRALFYYNCLQ